jgi:pentatricopeptide repeat protein
MGRKLHDQIVQEKLPQSTYISTSLINMYSKCDSLNEAEDFFHKMPKYQRKVGEYTAMINAYCRVGAMEKVEQLCNEIQEQGKTLSIIAFTQIISAYGKQGNVTEATNKFRQMQEQGLEPDAIVLTSLMHAYGKAGQLEEALKVFRQLQQQHQANIFSWSAIVAACGVNKDLETGRQLHQEFMASGLKPNARLLTALMNLYNKCGLQQDAIALFEQIPFASRDLASYTEMISVLAPTDLPRCIQLFEEFNKRGLKADVALTDLMERVMVSHAKLP